MRESQASRPPLRRACRRGRCLASALLLFIATATHAQLLPDEALTLSLDLGFSANFGRSFASGDFNGDGLDDLAVGSPGADRVIVYLGPRPGNVGQTILDGEGDFGRSLAACDFDNDGYDDLAIGAPEYLSAPGVESGRVTLYQGAPTGDPDLMTVAGALDEADAGETRVDGDDFGFSLAAGNFSGSCGLAVGVPGKEVDGHSSAGAARVFENAAGFSFTLFDSLDAGEWGGAEAGNAFGFALAAPPQDSVLNVGQLEFAVSAPFRTADGVAGAGEVMVYTSTFNSLMPDESHTEASLRPGVVPTFSFGFSLAAGNFNGNKLPELVIGAPYAALSSVDTRQVGGVHVLEPSFGGLQADFVTQDSLGVPDVAEPFDLFGASLAVGNFDGDPFADLAIGSPAEDNNDGSVTVLFGSLNGLVGAVAQKLDEVAVGGALSGEKFGDYLGTGDLDGDGADDLAVGLPLRGTMNEGIAYLVPSAEHLLSAQLLLEEGQQVSSRRGNITDIAEIPAITHDETGRLVVQPVLVDVGSCWSRRPMAPATGRCFSTPTCLPTQRSTPTCRTSQSTPTTGSSSPPMTTRRGATLCGVSSDRWLWRTPSFPVRRTPTARSTT